MGKLDDGGDDKYILKLFVSGASKNSVRAINNIKEILSSHLEGKYSLSIIDVHQEKTAAQTEQIVALPMLVKKFPLPEKRLIGDMSDIVKVLKGLGGLSD